MLHAGLAVIILLILLGFFVLKNIARAGKGHKISIRTIPGLSSIDEAIGRATEMGKPVLFCTGLCGVDDIATLNALSVLQYVAKRTAKFGTRLLISVANPTLYPVVEEICRQAYATEGKSEEFNAQDIRFFSDDQFAWASATVGLMHREKVASNFFFGSFAAESLILAESGQQVRAVQIASTPDFGQIPFFICTCDYTLIGEEHYAASAYLSREPMLLGSLVGQDAGKIIILVILLLGVISVTIWGGKGNWLLEFLK